MGCFSCIKKNGLLIFYCVIEDGYGAGPYVNYNFKKGQRSPSAQLCSGTLPLSSGEV